MSKFALSDDFLMLEAKAPTAFEEARKQEKNARGCTLPVGTTGTMTVTDIGTVKIPAKKDASGMVTKGEYIALTMQFLILSPEAFKGQTQSRMFNLDDHPNMSMQQKIAQWLDFCMDCGLPKEIRNLPTAEVVKWFAQEPRTCSYEVVANKDGFRNIAATSGNTTGAIPQATATNSAIEAALAQNASLAGQTQQALAGQPGQPLLQPQQGTFQPTPVQLGGPTPVASPEVQGAHGQLVPGEAYLCYGKVFEFVSMKDAGTAMMKSKSTGHELEVPLAQVQQM